MDAFGRKMEGKKSHTRYQNLGCLRLSTRIKALAILDIFRVDHSTDSFPETLKLSTSWWDRQTNEKWTVISHS